jgi:hypothetical protein
MAPAPKQRIGGVLAVLLGISGTAYGWYLAVHDGLLYEETSFIFPACIVVGVAMIFLQNSKEERIARREDVTKLHGWKLLTPQWKVIFLAALAMGLGNYLVLRLAFNWSE